MTIIGRRGLGLDLVATAAAVATLHRSRTAEFTLRFGHGYPSMRSLNVPAAEAAARIAEQSKGWVTSG